VLVYTRTYTDTGDTASRLKGLLEGHGLKAAILRASIDTSRREDCIFDQIDRGIDMLVTDLSW
jgi:hypothetical protein